MNIFRKILNYYSPKEPKYFKDKDGHDVRKVKEYTRTDEVKINLSKTERLKQEIKNFKLPFDIIIDDNGDILESYDVDGNPYSWRMKKHISYDNGTYTLVEEFEDYKEFKYRRVFNGLWLTEFVHTGDNGQTIENYVKRSKNNNNLVITEDTNNLYKKFGEKVHIKKPEEFLSYIDSKKVVYDKRKVYIQNLNKLTGDYDYKLEYVTSLYPYNDGLQGDGLLNKNNDNLYDGNVKK